MGILDIFKKGLNDSNPTTNNGLPGPTFFDGLTEHIENPIKLLSHEWRRKLKMSSGANKFKIKFYGKLHENYPNLIVGTDFAPSLIFAVDFSTGDEMLLFDGCKHGYNAMFCDIFSNEQQRDRKDGLIELVDGSKVELEEAKRNSFDTLKIFAINENGYISEITSEELA